VIHQIEYCKKCIEKLGSCGKMQLDLYVLCCNQYVKGQILYSKCGNKGRGDYLVYLLERKGYIVTTESEYTNFLAIKPVGYKKLKLKYMHVHKVCACRKQKKTP
jgi:uncharacterized protein YchJ